MLVATAAATRVCVTLPSLVPDARCRCPVGRGEGPLAV
jgi:hypothetical protein